MFLIEQTNTNKSDKLKMQELFHPKVGAPLVEITLCIDHLDTANGTMR